MLMFRAIMHVTYGHDLPCFRLMKIPLQWGMISAMVAAASGSLRIVCPALIFL